MRLTRIQSSRMRFGPYTLDISNQSLVNGHSSVTLRPKTFATLQYLAQNAGRIVTKQELLDAVWPDTSVADSVLKVSVAELRKLLDDPAEQPRYIETVHRRGYRFIAPVESVATEPIAPPQPVAGKVETTGPSARRARWLWPMVALIVVAAAAIAGWWTLQSRPRFRSVSVLPFSVDDGGDENRALADGLTESVIDFIAADPAIDVISRDASMRLRGRNADAQTLGRELEVDAVLVGRVRNSPAGRAIDAELVEVGTGKRIWGQSYSFRPEDALNLRAQLGQEIASQLRLRRAGATQTAGISPQAYQLYLRGRFQWNQRTPESVQRALSLYDEAIAVQPDNALAYAAKAEAFVVLSAVGGADRASDWLEKALASAQQARRFDAKLGSPLAVIAAVHFRRYEFDKAGENFRAAVAAAPNDATAHQWYSMYLAATGDHEHALQMAQRAFRLDPVSPIVQSSLATVMFYGGRHEAAIRELRAVADMYPQLPGPHLNLAEMYAATNRPAEALAELRTGEQLAGDAVGLELFARQPNAPPAELLQWHLRERLRILDKEPVPSSYSAATTAALAGDREAAMRHLETALSRRDPNAVFAMVDPRLSPIRADASFANVLAQNGLPANR